MKSIKKISGIIPSIFFLFLPSMAVASSGSAEPVKDGLTLGGFIDFQAGIRDQDLDTGSYSRGTVFRNDTEVHVTYQGTSDKGLTYGGVIELESDVTEADNDSGLNADKTFLYLQGGFGRFELGANSDAASRLGVDAATSAAAAGGIHGDYYLYVNFPEDAHHHHIKVIYTPTLPLAHAHGASEDATKITYFSPKVKGFQLGGSFIPDSGNSGTASGFTSETDGGEFENVFNLGASFSHDMGHDVSFVASVIGEFGDAEDATEEDLAAYALGLNITVNHITFGGSYGDWGKSTLDVGSASDDGYFWSLGAAYDYGHGNVSISYIDSEVDENEMANLSLGVDYSLAPGLTPYIEANFFDLNPGDTAISKNDGIVVLVGTQLNF